MKTFTLSSAAIMLAMCPATAEAQSRPGGALDGHLRTGGAGPGADLRGSLRSPAPLTGAGAGLSGSGSSSLERPAQVPDAGAAADTGTDLKRATRRSRRDQIDDPSKATATVRGQDDKASAHSNTHGGK